MNSTKMIQRKWLNQKSSIVFLIIDIIFSVVGGFQNLWCFKRNFSVFRFFGYGGPGVEYFSLSFSYNFKIFSTDVI